MQKNNIKTFSVSENIDYSQIKIFIDFYKDCLKEKKFNNEFELIIEIKNAHNNNSDTSNSIKGNVDFIFISYLILFIDEFKNTKVNFKFIDVENIDRAFSLRLQLEQLKQVTGFSNIFLEGEYVTKDGEIKNIYLSQNNDISQSQKFIPPIFIKDKFSVNYYFKISDPELNLLVKYYYENIIKSTNGKFKIEALSYIEYYLINLLILGKKNINENDFLTYKSIANKIAIGLKELATNINHSSKQKGVITARVYDKKTIQSLKSKTEEEFINTRKENLFLDINVIDFGNISIRKKYIKNLEDNYLNFGEILNKEDYKDDSELIENEYLYKDFFIVDINKLEKTYHQKNKLISRYGLQYFTHIISEEFNGFIKTSSQNEGIVFYKKDIKTQDSLKRQIIEKTDCDFVNQGTFYNCILPIDTITKNIISNTIDTIDTKNSASINCFYELEKYHVKPISEGNFNDYSLIKVDINKENKNIPYQNIISIYNQFQNIEKQNRNYIYIIDASETNIENESEWLRLLSVLTLDFKNLIIYNIDNNITNELFKLRKVDSKIKDYDFWNEESCVLFYSFKKRNNDRRFGANVLYGKDETLFNQINKKIYSHHYSFDFFENKFVTKDIYINSKLFKGNELLYFELILFNEDQYNSKFTLFEESIQYSLNTPLNVNIEPKNNSGYKIVETHFRLGSKIHISDFYYAKRMFQNSFFTTPFAFLLAKEIFNKKSVIKTSNILLYGYESYSDFLLSTTRKLLDKMFRNTYKIVHSTLVSDKLTREIDFKEENFSIITIVPIASSFSTSVKMRNLFQNFMKNEKIEFIEPFYNLVLVADNNFEEKINENGFFTCEKLMSFNWYSLKQASKEINIKTHIVEDDSIKQKYFVPVYTNWHKAENRDDCYPKKSIHQEKCLFETGKESITPQLIFDYPIVKESISFNYLSFKISLFYYIFISNINLDVSQPF